MTVELPRKFMTLTVVQWFNQQQIEQLYLSIVTIAEIKKGIYKIQDSQPERYQRLLLWLKTTEVEFSSRILPINNDTLDNWAKICTKAELNGKKLAVMDSLIAATAHHHELILVTRNVDDFKMTPIKIINPYLQT
jgi:hypothetical protein